MKKTIFIVLAMLLSVGSTNVSAQSFLKKLGKEIENNVEKKVTKKINNLKKKKNSKSENQSQEQTQQGKRKTLAPTVVEAQPNNAPTTGKINNHEWVDLGLPSGTLWATCNVDATKSSQPGKLYAWGEIATKTSYTQGNSKNYKKNIAEFSGDKTKDVATSKWGKGWRMPTKTDFDELLHYCNWSYIQKDGRWGAEISSPINGKSIFLPVTGYKEDAKHLNASGNGMYWTATPYEDVYNNGAHEYHFGGALGEMGVSERSSGFAIRPVADNNDMINIPSQGETQGHKWVDLGLPSGTKWATCNIGAATSEHIGDFFAWAEITTIFDKKSPKNKARNKWMSGIGGSAKYDAATALWGESWKIPTKADFQELIDNCTWEWTTLGRRKGCKVISKINGNYIFFHAAGRMTPNSIYTFPSLNKVSVEYWASTPSKDPHYINADGLLVTEKYLGTTTQDRRNGFLIRPVTK